jgi:hypothetical protein
VRGRKIGVRSHSGRQNFQDQRWEDEAMKRHVQVLLIGVVVGCSVLYHLVRLGWRDVALCERRELTPARAGTTQVWRFEVPKSAKRLGGDHDFVRLTSMGRTPK